MRLLLVEDDKDLREILTKVLYRRKYSVDKTESASEAISLAAKYPYDVILLDVLLPDGNGIDVCRDLRKQDKDTYVMMMSIQQDVDCKVKALNIGADDYLPKPFEMEELLARLRTLMRRGARTNDETIEIGKLTLDLNNREAYVKGKELRLTNREFMLLEYLTQRVNQPVSREDIVDHVWDMGYCSFSNVVDVFVYMLRKKLTNAGLKKNTIQSVRSIGYRFCMD